LYYPTDPNLFPCQNGKSFGEATISNKSKGLHKKTLPIRLKNGIESLIAEIQRECDRQGKSHEKINK
jgi:hypothetical protein